MTNTNEMNNVVVNAFPMTLDEYKALLNENTILADKLRESQSLVTALEGKVTFAQHLQNLAQVEAEKNKQVLYVRKDRFGFTTNNNGIKMEDVKSPDMISLIKENLDSAQEEKIKQLESNIKDLTARMEDIQFVNERKKTKVGQENQTNIDNLEQKYTKKIKNLQEELSQLREDYENLKLDKAEEILEQERLDEIKRLNEKIGELSVDKNEDSYWKHGLFYILFKKRINERASYIAENMRRDANWKNKEVDERSAIKKARKFLESFTSLKKDTSEKEPIEVRNGRGLMDQINFVRHMAYNF